MRWIAAPLIVGVLLAACGGGSEVTYTEVSSGHEAINARETPELERQMKKLNPGSSVTCSDHSRDGGPNFAGYWDCEIAPTGGSNRVARVEVTPDGLEGQYKVVKCRPSRLCRKVN